MWQKFLIIFHDHDLRRKFLYLFGFLAVFRLAASVPILGIDRELFQSYFQDNQLLGLLNIFSGGALDNGTEIIASIQAGDTVHVNQFVGPLMVVAQRMLIWRPHHSKAFQLDTFDQIGTFDV